MLNLTRFIMGRALAACLLIALTAAYASAASITVNTNVGAPVAGNGTGIGLDSRPNGTAPFTGDPNYNTLNIVTGAVVQYADGAFTDDLSTNATYNRLNISGGTVTEEATGGYAEHGSATDNTVTISGGNFGPGSSVYGGRGDADDAKANENTVIISGGTFNNTDVYGGRATTVGTNVASNNRVIIESAFNGTINNLYGGYTSGTSSGNELHLKASGLSITGDLNYFQNLNFYLPTSLAAGQTMITVGGIANITDTKVNVGVAGRASPLEVGDDVILIKAGTLTGQPANDGQTVTGNGMHGVTLGYEFEIFADNPNNELLATVTKVAALDSNEAFSEGMAAGAALVNVGADFAAGKGIGWAMGAAGQKGSGSGFGGFGGVQGGKSRYKTGSHVDMSSVSLIAGLAWGNDFDPGRLTLAGFFEYGNGSYDTYNSFANTGSIKGKGDMYHVGGGLLSRFDANCGGYAESSFRVGSLHNEYKNNDLWGAKYTSNSTYYGFHLGAGYIWNINEKASLDLSGKYFWTRVEGDSVTLNTGDPIKFKDVDSSRLRFGGRFAYAVNEYVSPYVGAAYEHEFDGKARATTSGFAIKAPSLRGDTGIGELGFTLKPSQTLPLSFDLGVQGYTGKREGVTGSLQLRFEF